MSRLFDELLDDAAVFPPGNLPLAEAVPAHERHLAASYGPTVGPLVLTAADLPGLVSQLEAARDPAEFDLALTAPLPDVADALAHTERHGALRLVALEVAVPDGLEADGVVPMLEAALGGREPVAYVELPRDERRPALVEALSRSRFLAKLRTGGVRADLHPGEQELAEAVVALEQAGVPFKATAGLHHAVRNTDPTTGFEQHGFLNLLAAVAAATDGASVDRVASLLALRGTDRVVDTVAPLDAAVRERFRSFGTCSIVEPLRELAALGLLPPRYAEDLA